MYRSVWQPHHHLHRVTSRRLRPHPAAEHLTRSPGHHVDQLVAEEQAMHALFEGLLAPAVELRVRRIDLLQPGEDVARDDHHVERIGVDVGIAVDMNAALGAGERRRLLQEFDAGPRGDVARSALHDAGVARHVQQSGHPEFEIQPRRDEQIGVAHGGLVGRSRTHEVRVLVAAADRFHRGVIAGDLFRGPGVVRQRGHDAEFPLRGPGAGRPRENGHGPHAGEEQRNQNGRFRLHRFILPG